MTKSVTPPSGGASGGLGLAPALFRVLMEKPLNYTRLSLVKFQIKESTGYLLFVPPNLNSEYRELEGKPSLAHGFYALYPASEGTIYYRRFDTYLLGYAVSLLTLIVLVAWYKKDTLERLFLR